MSDIVERFSYQVAHKPNFPAVIDHERVITYQELNVLAKRVASFLLTYKKHPRVLVMLPQGIEAYASIIGVVMAGGYYCPINVALPQKRKAQIAELFDPDFVITNSADFELANSIKNQIAVKNVSDFPEDTLISGYEDTFIKGKFEIINFDKLPHNTESYSFPSTNHDLAYVIFTSGSTGQPKGVMIKRQAVSRFIDWSIETIDPTPNDRWGQFSNLGFDLSVMDMYTALGCGATLIPLNTPKDRLMPATAIQRHKLTIWHSVPSVIDLMGQAKQITSEFLKTIRLMSFCGEPLRPQHLSSLFSANSDMTIFNTYGPTEGTVFCTWLPLTAENYLPFCDVSAAIGKPIPGWTLHLWGGQDLNEGEIVISGDFIGAGYWRNLTATKKAYRNLKIDNHDCHAYYTGDWAERRDQNLFFRNRVDRQVKVHGFRVELGEVDYFVREFGVLNSYSLLHHGKICTFLEIGDFSIDEVALQKFLKERLPSYAIPSRFVTKRILPRNQNDKIDTNLLHSFLEDIRD